MLQSEPQKTNLFRTSLRDWQANFKARQAAQAPSEAQAEIPTATPTTSETPKLTTTGKPRVKRLVAYKKRKQRQASR